jgi:RNA polymerase sigma-70 factor (ECF subfamily)
MDAVSASPPPTEYELLFERYRRNGDLAALGRVYDLAAPQLQALARRLAPSRADADDLLQATFVTAIERADSFDATRKLLPWLLGILAHHALAARRGRARVPQADQLASRASEDPAVLAEQSELSAFAHDALAELPQRYRDVLGPVLIDDERAVDVAARRGASAGVVRMQVHRGLELLRRALPTGAALGGLLWFGRARALGRIREHVLEQARSRGGGAPARFPGRLVASPFARWTGVLAIVGLCGWWWFDADAAPPALESSPVYVASSPDPDSEPAVVASPDEPRRALSEPPADESSRAAAAVSARGGLDVRVRWSDGTEAESVELVVWRLDAADPARQALHGSTDARGHCFFGDCVGRLSVRADRAAPSAIDVLAGERRTLDIDLPGGSDVTVHVLDANGAGVPNARIGLSTLHHYLFGAELARTDESGAARVRDMPAGRRLVAWKPGYVSSLPQAVPKGDAEGRATATLVLRSGGATLRGCVLDAFGRPAVGAEVRTGPDPSLRVRDDSAATAFVTRTDRLGNYVLNGLPGAAVELRVRHADAAPFHTLLELAPDQQRVQDVRLEAGARIRGTVRTLAPALGGAVAGGSDDEVWITLGEPGTFDCVQHVARVGMPFELCGIGPGRHDLYANAKAGLAHIDALELAVGQTLDQDIVLEPPARIAGRIVERGTGRALANWHVVAHVDDSGRIAYARSDERGEFTLGGIAVERADLSLHAPGQRNGAPQHVLRGVAAGTLDLYLELVDPSAR